MIHSNSRAWARCAGPVHICHSCPNSGATSCLQHPRGWWQASFIFSTPYCLYPGQSPSLSCRLHAWWQAVYQEWPCLFSLSACETHTTDSVDPSSWCSLLLLIDGVMSYSLGSVYIHVRPEMIISCINVTTPLSPPMVPHPPYPLVEMWGRLGHGQHWKRSQ